MSATAPPWRRWRSPRQGLPPRQPQRGEDRCGGSPGPPSAAHPYPLGSPKQRGGRLLCRPLVFRRRTYFRLVIAVRSAESLTMPVAPHQFEPNAVAPLPGLIAVTKVGLALVVL